MKAFFYISALLLLFSVQGLGQDFMEFSNAHRQKRVLVVPFDERIYFNEATADIAKRDQLTHDEIMQFFRYQLNLQLVNSLIDSCEIVDIMQNNTREDEADLTNLYTTLNYEFRVAEFEPETEGKGYFARKRAEKDEQARRKVRAEQNSRAKASIRNGELVGGERQKTDDLYLHIIIEQPEVLQEIATRRKIDYYLFINQFDIKTDLRDPYMSGNSNIQRIMRIHFSIYNENGEFVSGNYASTKIPFYEDSKEQIVNLYFPELMRQIIKKIKF